MFYLYYFFYLLAWFFGSTRRGIGTAKIKRIGVRLTIFSVLALVAFVVLISSVQMGALIFATIPLFLLFPMLALGIGLVTSAVANDLSDRDLNISSNSVRAISLIGPSLAILLFGWDQHIDEQQRRDDLAAFQAGELVGQIGVEKVRFPASPQLKTIHSCQRDQLCHTKFWHSGDTLQDLATYEEDQVHFTEIELIPVHSTCDGSTAPLNACLLQSELQRWCEKRASHSKSVWCLARPRHSVVFSTFAESNLKQFQEESWLDTDTDILGTDYLGDPIEIECRALRDESILSDPDLSRYCRLKFSVAAQVIATVYLDRFEPPEMKPHATTMLEYVSEIWAAISQKND